MRASLLLLLLSTAACWQPRYFAPRENLNGTGPDGDPAAVYSLPATPPATGAGELRLWSRGAKARFTDDAREVVELRIGFELENNGNEPLRLDLPALTCEELYIDGLLQPPLKPVRFDGDGLASPGTTARVDAVFEPAAKKPRHVDSFAIRFEVQRADSSVLRQVTPFGPVRYADADDLYWRGSYWGPGYGGAGYWGPGYWGPGFGFGWGYGWHSHCH